MKSLRIWKRISGAVLSVVLMAGMGMTVFAAPCACSYPGECWACSGMSCVDNAAHADSCSCPRPGSASGKDDRTSEQKVSDRIDREISKAISQSISEGGAHGCAKIDGRAHGIHTLSCDTMKKLNDANIDAEFSFDYEGNHYVITIPAGQAPVSEDVPWCGPMYLMSLFADSAVVTPIE